MKHPQYPPAAHYPLQADSRLTSGVAGLWLAFAVLLLAWWWLQPVHVWSYRTVWLGAMVAWGLCGWGLKQWLAGLPRGWLVWTGLGWRLEQDLPIVGQGGRQSATEPAARQMQRHEGVCRLVLDLQHAMLLCWQGDGGPAQAQVHHRWIWVTRQNAPQHWHALRCAIHGTVDASSGPGHSDSAHQARA